MEDHTEEEQMEEMDFIEEVFGLFEQKIIFSTQACLMEEVGFEDIDIAWRQEAFFVAGGRKRIV